MLSHSNLIRREAILGWEPLDIGWIKCNVDGARGEDGSTTSCGGLLRDSRGSWMTSFNRELDAIDILTSEMCGIIEGLKFSWAMGFKCVCFETDSRTALALINSGGCENLPLSYLIQQIVEFKGRQWNLRLRWCYRECNEAANWMAKEALD